MRARGLLGIVAVVDVTARPSRSGDWEQEPGSVWDNRHTKRYVGPLEVLSDTDMFGTETHHTPRRWAGVLVSPVSLDSKKVIELAFYLFCSPSGRRR